VLGKLLISRWRAMAAKVPDQKIIDGMSYAELVLNDYGDLLDNGKESRETRAVMLRNAIDHLYDAYAASVRLSEGGLAKKIKFLMGLCGLMLDDAHTRMFHLDPFIEEAVAWKLRLETEASDAAEIYAELSATEMSLVDGLVGNQVIKNVIAACNPEHFHCGRTGNAWTGNGVDPLAKAIGSYAKKSNVSGQRVTLVEKIVVLLVLKTYRDQKIIQCETFLSRCESRTIHRSFRPAFGTKRLPY
jgi:hypothetical protein